MKQIAKIKGFILNALFLLSMVISVSAQNGLENIIVEKYYVSNSSDSAGSSGVLRVGSVTYRIYADLLPGYNFQALYGVPGHNLLINTTTAFFNNEDYGATTPSYSVTNARKNTVMLDSWFSVGGAATGKLGVLKSEDTDGSIGNLNGLLTNTVSSIGIPLNMQDGLVTGTPVAVTFVGLNNTGNGDLGVFDGLSQVGNTFSTNNGSIAALGGSVGATSSNRVLIGQFTTNGIFHFELNVQIGTPTGGVQNYVSSNPVGAEKTASFLSGTFGVPLVVSASIVQNILCFGLNTGSASVTATGGNSPYTYLWSNGSTNNGITNLSPGTYSVVVTDAMGNSSSSSVTLVSPSPLPVVVTAPAAVSVCANSACSAVGINLGIPSATGCGTITYSNNGPSQYPVGTTTIVWTATDASGNTGTATQSITVSDNTAPGISLLSSGLVAAVQGPSSSKTPYVLPVENGVKMTSLLSTEDQISGYAMGGIPDGLGAFDNCDGTFTLLMNHELLSTQGVTRAHGKAGAYVSKWIINKSNLSVLRGSDLMTSIYGWNSTTQTQNSTPISGGYAFYRFCSADLPSVSAYYNAATGKGSRERIFMHGEEGGSTGYQLATVVTGVDSGKVYILGKFNLATNGSGLSGIGAWENALANPYSQDKTVVVGNCDGGTGIMSNSVSVYVGTKQTTGTEIDKAGLSNGTLKFVNVTGNTAEIINTISRATGITSGTRFTLSSTSSTTFSRPEDGCWNPLNPNQYYFVTTDQLDKASDGLGTQIGMTRLWRLTFDSITNPDLGGKIDLLIDGATVNGVKVNMFDNITADKFGNLILLEDVGNAAHNGKVWRYNVFTNTLTMIAKHDPARFGDVTIAATSPFNQDEETSGVIDASDILGSGMNLIVDQAHYSITGQAVEGGQLLAMYVPALVGPSVATAKDTVRAYLVAGACSTTVMLGTPASGDNCSVSNVTNNAPSQFGVGTTNVVWTATDASGNNKSVTQVVMVMDTISPQISNVTACDNYTWSLNGQTYSTSGVYNTVVNCYKYRLNLTINPTIVTTANVSSCGSYSWPISGLTYTVSGIYTVTNGCNVNKLNLQVNPIPQSTLSVTNANCTLNSGGIIANVTGGTGSMNYLWSNGQTSSSASILSPGTYSVTITDAAGCTTSASATVIANLLSVSAVGMDVSCYGSKNGSVTATTSGGVAPYSFVWYATGNSMPISGQSFSSLSNAGAGSYYVKVTDNKGCSITSNAITISQPQPIVLSVSKTNVSCFGGSNATANAAASGGVLPYTFVWKNSSNQVLGNNSITNIPAGIYTITATDANGCSKSASITITQPVAPLAVSISVNLATQSATAAATGGTSPYSYLWSNGQRTATATGIVSGATYSVRVNDAKACIVNASTGALRMENPANTSSGLDAILYPNPTSGNVTIEFSGSESEHLKFNIYDFTGRKIYDEVIIASVGVNYIYYDFSGYPQGVYFISLEKNDMINTLRVVVR